LQELPSVAPLGIAESSTRSEQTADIPRSSEALAAGPVLAPECLVPEPQRTVYILQSAVQPRRFYTGLTSNLESRLRAHNLGLSRHTASGRPWRVVVTMEFADSARAAEFEEYLKSGSGRTFAARHLR